MRRLVLFIFCLTVSAVAQDNFLGARPHAAAVLPLVEASAGFTYVGLDTPSQQRSGLGGFDANAVVDFNPRWGLKLDSSYARVGDVLSTGHSGNVSTFLIGPTFYPADRRNTRFFVHAMAGIGLVDSAVPTRGTFYLGGTVTRFASAIGGGVERAMAGPLSVRVGADYLRTTFANSGGTIQSQNNLRMVSDLVFRFGSR